MSRRDEGEGSSWEQWDLKQKMEREQQLGDAHVKLIQQDKELESLRAERDAMKRQLDFGISMVSQCGCTFEYKNGKTTTIECTLQSELTEAHRRLALEEGFFNELKALYKTQAARVTRYEAALRSAKAALLSGQACAAGGDVTQYHLDGMLVGKALNDVRKALEPVDRAKPESQT